ncbi:hypothetical protein BDB00DRAFT_849451 [Zychaea mexicana]|uniref:uncharacterized protein n=1 Tax=Zychaea mexicana TaxID=64656 RepID=UPI0022FDCA00|nr:uncharacterized protein BDB00DRAFT_849451 [Zychaea mexicana]KAI9488159.1 hypothetical protein BDB00DRAFT_849451 [Zychaea mexicana]
MTSYRHDTFLIFFLHDHLTCLLLLLLLPFAHHVRLVWMLLVLFVLFDGVVGLCYEHQCCYKYTNSCYQTLIRIASFPDLFFKRIIYLLGSILNRRRSRFLHICNAPRKQSLVQYASHALFPKREYTYWQHFPLSDQPLLAGMMV